MKRFLVFLRILFEAAIVITLVFMFRRPPGVPLFLYSHVIYGAPVDEKIVALTYDDGPHPKFTPEILDILDKYRVKATFYMIGSRVKQYPGVAWEVARRGHAIGNHTFSHAQEMENENDFMTRSELESCEKTIEKATGAVPQSFRPPRGNVSASMVKVTEEEGYPIVLWTVSADHHEAPTPEEMAARVLNHLKPGDIILLHDGYFGTRWKDVAATPLIIEELRKRGYRFVTVPELLKIRSAAYLKAEHGYFGARWLLRMREYSMRLRL